MQVRLLGPLEVDGDDGQPVALGGRQAQALFGLLAVEANRLVPVSRLIDELWGDEPPASARKTVQTYVYRLRRMLGSERLQSSADGYRLVAADEEIDAVEFGHRVAANDVEQALGLWRGPALAGLESVPALASEAAHLEQMRADAIEQGLDSSMAAGQHARLIPQLEMLVREQPLREALRARLMLALYRAGRQADALEVYRHGRSLLADELGLEPSEQLRELERQILAHDAVLELPAGRPLPGSLPAGGKLPTPPNPLIGRQRELDEILALLSKPASRLVTLIGPGGSGKTRLALEVAAHFEAKLHAPAFFVELAPLADPELVLSVIAQTLGLEDGGQAPLHGTLGTFLRNRRLLVVLDNFEHLLDASPEIASLVAAVPGLAVLATSRSPLRIRAEVRYETAPLPPADALALFTERARAVRADFALTADAQETCRRVCVLLDGLPLALELAAARLNVVSVATLHDRLSKRLPLPTASARDLPKRQRTLEATVDWSCELLRSGEQRLFARLAVFAGGWTLEAAEQVCDSEPEELATLVDANLVRFDGARFTMLETIRMIAEVRFAELLEADRLRQTHARYFADRAAQLGAEQLAMQGVQRRRWWDRAAAELGDLRRAFDWAVRQGDRELALRLISDGVLAFWSTVPDGRRLTHTALEMPGTSSPEAEAPALLQAGILAIDVDDPESSKALLEEALRRYRTLGDVSKEALTLAWLGWTEASSGAVERGRTYLREAAALSRKVSAREPLAFALHSLGELERELGRHPQAADLLEDAIRLSEEAGDDRRATRARHSLGDLRLEQGDAEAAENLYRSALKYSRSEGDRLFITYSLGGLAASAATRGDLERAGRLWGVVEGLEDERGAPLRLIERSRYARFLATLDVEALSHEYGVGRSLELDQAIDYALAEAHQPRHSAHSRRHPGRPTQAST